jgi:phospholipid-binding lipoprotein MlaA
MSARSQQSSHGGASALRCCLFLLALLLLPACAANEAVPRGEVLEPPIVQLDSDDPDAAFPIDIHDPWEGWNRQVYLFNARFDQMVFIPVVESYRFVVPGPMRDSVDNFFTNLDNLITFANLMLQGKPMAAAQTVFRFALNSTLGVFGLFDPSSAIDVPQHQEDFGQTLGVWGVGDGPYMVLPVLGPSNTRDTVGLITDRIAFSLIDPFGASSFQTDYPPVLALNVINARDRVEFRYYQTGSPFEYDLVRFLYTKKRELDIAK